MSAAWEKCLKSLQEDLSLQNFTLWVKPISAVEVNNALTLYVPNKKTFDWIDKNLAKKITTLVKQHNSTMQVSLKSKMYRESERTSPVVTTPLSEEYCFDNMVVGDANQVVFSATQQIASNIKKSPYNPFIIYGASGLGKTHLLQAAGILAKEIDKNTRIIYTPLMDFVKNITSGLRHNNIDKIKHFYQSADMLLVDDIHHIAGKTKSQEEFFHIFNYLFSTKKQIILTCDELPRNIFDLEQRLATRFNSGLNLQLQPPELEMRAAILMKKAHAMGFTMSDDIALYIAQKITQNVRELEGCLMRLKAYLSFTQHKGMPTRELVNNALSDLFQTKNNITDIANIQKTICQYYAISLADLVSKMRNKNIVSARHMGMFLTRELTSMSLPSIGKDFGNKDHTSVMHACKKVKGSLDNDPRIKQDYQNLKFRLCE